MSLRYTNLIRCTVTLNRMECALKCHRTLYDDKIFKLIINTTTKFQYYIVSNYLIRRRIRVYNYVGAHVAIYILIMKTHTVQGIFCNMLPRIAKKL